MQRSMRSKKENVSDAEKLLVRLIKVKKKLLRKEHTDTFSSMAIARLAANLAGQ